MHTGKQLAITREQTQGLTSSHGGRN